MTTLDEFFNEVETEAKVRFERMREAEAARWAALTEEERQAEIAQIEARLAEFELLAARAEDEDETDENEDFSDEED